MQDNVLHVDIVVNILSEFDLNSDSYFFLLIILVLTSENNVLPQDLRYVLYTYNAYQPHLKNE